MFRYYNYGLIESNRSYSTEKIKKLLSINPQTVRGWIKEGRFECVSRKPILIYGATLKAFIKERNTKHKKTLDFKEMKCLKCKAISSPKNNQISIYHNKNGSIRVAGICVNCDNELSKLYKKNRIDDLAKAFYIKPAASTLYNTSRISSKAHLISQKESASNEAQSSQKGNIKAPDRNANTKANIIQQTLFDFDYD